MSHHQKRIVLLDFAPKRRGFICLRCFVCAAALLSNAFSTEAQTTARLMDGSVRTAGRVLINGTPAAAEQTVFTGETISTASDGAALARFSGFELIISANSEAIFLVDGRSVLLKRGSFSARSFLLANVMALKFGNSSLSVLDPDSSFLIGVRDDGAAWIECHAGRGSVQRPGDAGTISLRAGDRLGLLPDGTMESGAPPAGQPAKTSADADPPPQSSRRRKIPLWVYGAGAGAAVAGAVVALTHSNRTGSSSGCPMSPSNFVCQ